jgi:hypothetical protein
VITANVLRVDLPEFQDAAKYPDSQIVYYLRLAPQLMAAGRWGAPAPLSGVGVTIQTPGSGYLVNDVLIVSGGIPNTPTRIIVDSLAAAGAVATAHASVLGDYGVIPNNSVSVTGGAGVGAQFNLAYAYGVPTLFDFGLEMFVAHHLALERRAQDESLNGNVPGWAIGMISSKSVDKATINYDVAGVMEKDAGHWNLTIYGLRFRKLMQKVGVGPLFVGVDSAPNPLGSFAAWTGPSTVPGPTGFGS